jgi:chaperonin GroES
MKGKVLKEKLLVRQDEAETTTASGVIIPDIAQEKPKQGEVVIVGDDIDEISVGDRVFFADHAGTPLSLQEEELELEGDFVLLGRREVLFIKST